MGNCCGGSATVPPSSPSRPLPAPTQETAPSTHPTSTPSSHVAFSPSKIPAHGAAQHAYEMPTLHKYSAEASERMPSQDSTSSQRRRDDRDNPSPPSGSNPHSQEMPSYLFKPRGKVSPQLQKSISMDTPLQGPQPTGTQVESVASGTRQIPADSQERQPFFPSALQSLLSNDFRCVVRCRAVGHNKH
jgi:hypothetical protein